MKVASQPISVKVASRGTPVRKRFYTTKEKEAEQNSQKKKKIDAGLFTSPMGPLRFSELATTPSVQVVEFNRAVGDINMIALSLFSHETNDRYFVQLRCNQRYINTKHVKQVLVPAVLQSSTGSSQLTEQTFVLPYELTEVEASDTVPVFGTSCPDGSNMPPIIEGVYARYPTKGAVRKLLQVLCLPDLEYKYFGDDYSLLSDDEPVEAPDIFVDILRSPIMDSLKFDGSDFFPDIPDLSLDDTLLTRYRNKLHYQYIYRRIKNKLLKLHRIRFSFYDGQHRQGAALQCLEAMMFYSHHTLMLQKTCES
jgi:hypothetical protein